MGRRASMSSWQAGDVVRPKRGGSRARETVVYAKDGAVVTIWETRGGTKSMCRTEDEMERYMEKVV